MFPGATGNIMLLTINNKTRSGRDLESVRKAFLFDNNSIKIFFIITMKFQNCFPWDQSLNANWLLIIIGYYCPVGTIPVL